LIGQVRARLVLGKVSAALQPVAIDVQRQALGKRAQHAIGHRRVTGAAGESGRGDRQATVD